MTYYRPAIEPIMFFLIYSKDNCVYCTRAKNWINTFFNDGRYYIEFKNPPQQVVNTLKETTGQTTYPFIFCGNTFVGGYDKLANYDNVSTILENEFDYCVDF
jgi:glutaredoxin